MRPTLAGEGRAIAHAAYDASEKVEKTDRSIGTVLLLQAAGVGWALPNIRILVGHDTVSAMTSVMTMTAEDAWLVPLTTDPWPEGSSVAPAAPLGILDHAQDLAR